MIAGIFGSEVSKEEKEELEEKIQEKEKEIAELKEKIENLENRVEKQRKRAKKAITEKQEVDKELKKSKQRIETLKDKLSKTKENKEERKFREASMRGPKEVKTILKNLENYETKNKTFRTQYFLNPESAKTKNLQATAKKINSETGYVALWDETDIFQFVLVPPIPMEEEVFTDNRFHLEKLTDLYNSDIKIGFASLHAGRSGVGTLSGLEVKEFDVVSTQVKEKHSKGGFSQGRFERGRKEQIREHAKKVMEEMSALFGDLDYFVLSGNKRIMKSIKKDMKFDAEIIERNLDIGSIDKNSGSEISEKVWSCKTYIP